LIIIFMGTPEFAVPSLEACTSLGEVALVVTQPDRPRGRGQKVTPSPVKAWANARGIAVAQPEKLKGTDFDQELTRLRPDVIVVAAYGKILPAAILAVPARGCVNVHASLLPRYRGAAPIQWAIASGEAETGISLMRMEAGLDTGPVISQRAIPITQDETGGSLSGKLSLLGAQMLREDLPRYVAGSVAAVPQDSAKATLAPLIKKEDTLLDFRRPAVELERRIRAFAPDPGTSMLIGGQPHKVWKARVVPGSGAPGEVLHAGTEGLHVGTGEEALEILELTPPGRRRMQAVDFLAGHRLPPGTKLNT
jgi:methionyl-tRNA formyltransferase